MSCIRRAAWMCGIGALCCVWAGADVPRQVHYQGQLHEVGGGAFTGAVELRFRLYDHSTNSTIVLFDETHPTVAVANGLFARSIGSQTPGGIPDSALNSSEIYLEISVEGGLLWPRARLGAAPWSREADTLENFHWSTGIAYPNPGYGVKEYVDQFNPAVNADPEYLLFSP